MHNNVGWFGLLHSPVKQTKPFYIYIAGFKFIFTNFFYPSLWPIVCKLRENADEKQEEKTREG